MPLYSFCDERYLYIKIGTNWCLFILTVMRDFLKIGTNLVPISFCDNERYCQIKIGTNWCLFILTVMRDSVISKSATIGADLDLTISLRSTVRMNKGGTNWCRFLLLMMRLLSLASNQNYRHQLVPLYSLTVMRDTC